MPLSACSRRQVIFGLGLLGLPLSRLLRASEAVARFAKPRAAPFGRARSCILVLLKGGPSQLDTFDMKPAAPAEIRGPFCPIATNVSGLQISEHLPALARQMDQVRIVRSVSHTEGVHSTAAYWMTTGRPFGRPGESISSRDDAPHFGAVASAFDEANAPAVPYALVPDYLIVNGELRGGQNAGLLGSRFDPLVPGGDSAKASESIVNMGLSPRISQERMVGRANLLTALESGKSRSADDELVDQYRHKALELVHSESTQRALSIDRESDAVRDRYGRCQFGQSVLMARRLVEAGVRLVHVNCMSSVTELTRNWDTHKDNFNTLKNVLLPRADRALAALLADLAASGLLDQTLVIVMGEFGRTPKINADAGRDHWPQAQSILLAGAGIPGGSIYGATDGNGAYPVDAAVSPAQLAATIFHVLGIDPALELVTWAGRPYKICDAQPVLKLWHA